MKRNRFNIEKHKRVVRDIYTGKIINDKEAISLENLEIALEKEGLKYD